MLLGRVRGPDGKAAKAARIHIRNQTDPSLLAFGLEQSPVPRSWETRSDERGQFSLRLAPGQLYRVWAQGNDGASVSSVHHGVHNAQRLRLDLVSSSPIRIQPRPGNTWEGGLLCFLIGWDHRTQREFAMLSRWIPGTTQAVLPPVPPGRYRLLLRSRDCRSYHCQLLLLPAKELVIEPSFRAPARLELAGDGAALSGSRIYLPPTLQFPGEEKGILGPKLLLPAFSLLLRLRLESPGKAWTQHELGPVHPGMSYRISTKAPLGRTVQLSLGSKRNGKRLPPLAGASLILAWRSDNGGVQRRLVYPRASLESITIAALPQSEILAIFRDGRAGVRAQKIEAGSDTSLEILAEEAMGFDLLLEGQEDSSASHARLFVLPLGLTHAGGLEELFPLSAYYPGRHARGRIRLPSLPEGKYRLIAEMKYHIPQAREFLVSRHKRSEVADIVLERGQRLHGRVLGSDGKPAKDVLVKLSHPLEKLWPHPLETNTDANGYFAFFGLSEGRYLLEARREREGNSELARLTHIKWQPQEYELRLKSEDPKRRGGGR